IQMGEASAPTQQATYLAKPKNVLGRREFLSVVVVRITPVSNSTLVDIEEFEEHTRRRTNMIVEKLEAFGSTTSTGVSGEIFGVFGPLSTYEEDIQNAIAASLEIDDALTQENQKSSGSITFSHAIGIDTGVVYLRISENGKVLYDVFGPPITNALEMSRRNQGPNILATEKSVRRLQSLFSLAPQPAITHNTQELSVVAVLGKQRPSYLLTGEAWHSQNTFVGREDFLAKIGEQWAKAQKNSLTRIVIMGEPGVGKTRLATEFLRQKIGNGEEVHFVRCRRQDRSAPLEPMHALSESLGLSDDNPTMPSDTQPAHSSREVRRLDSKLLNALSGRKTIVLFDDWQWADDASRAMLGKFISELSDQPVMFLFTIRGNEISDEAISDVQPFIVQNMEMAEVSRTAEKLLGWMPEEKLKRYIYNKSGGNPFFIEEICHAFLHDASGNIDDLSSEKLPGTMQAMMVTRFENLDPLQRKVIEVTAIHGDGLELSLLSAVLGEEVDESILNQLTEVGLLSPRLEGEELNFKHGITFDIIYNTIGLSDRRELHAQFAAHLASVAGPNNTDDFAEQLAFHHRGAGQYEQAVIYAVRAGDKALSLSSLDQAKNQYGTALELIDQCEPTEENRMRWLTTAMRWGLPCIYAPARDQLPILSKAVRLAREFGDTGAMAVVNHWIGYIQLVIGDYADAIKNLNKAEELSHSAKNERLESDVIATRGFVHAARCDYIRAQRDIESALKARENNPGSGRSVPVLSSYAMATLAVVKSDQGDFAEGNRLIKTALERVKQYNHEIESSISNLGSAILLWQGRWAEAKDLAERSCRRSEIVNSPYLINMARCIHGYSIWRTTGDTAGIDMLCAAADRLWDSKMRLYISFCYGWVSDACAMTGRREEAIAASERALELAQFGEPVGAAMASRSLAILSANGNGTNTGASYEKAYAHIAEAKIYAHSRNSPHELAITLLHEARLKQVFKDKNAALKNLAEATNMLTEQDMHWHKKQATEMEKQIRAGSFINDPSRITDFIL
ncbi:MAG: AAA family ATPase, partial [Rhizobiaceae bacterium]|nr:AAA family ATPase [Rhizobiaceae bacterium]